MAKRSVVSGSHWGAFRMDLDGDRLTGIRPLETDREPSDLIESWAAVPTDPMRVHYPSIREGYLAGDGGAGRGRDRWRTVSWETALDLVAGEIGRIRRDHGNQAIFGGSYGWSSAGRVHHARSLIHRFLASCGGFTTQYGNYSYGAAMALLPFVVGGAEGMNGHVTSLATIAKAGSLLVAFGGLPRKNWAVQSGGLACHRYDADMQELAEGGVEVLTISPYRGDQPDCPDLARHWQPVRPGSDTALMLALTWELCRTGRADRGFIERYCTGWSDYERYLSGTSDGIEKTADWAAALTGIPAVTIRALADDMNRRPTMLTATWSLQRAENGEQTYWALIALAAALGRIGLPGQGYGFGYGSIHSIGDPGYFTPITGIPPLPNAIDIRIPCARVTDMLENPGKTIRFGLGQITYPDIRMIYWAGGNPFHHHQDLRTLARAFRRPDTVVVNEMFWTATARHADIVLPATSPLERNDIGGSSREGILTAMQRGPAPPGEARDDYAIFAELAERLGAGQIFTEGRSTQDWLERAWGIIRDRLTARSIDAPTFARFWQDGWFQLPEPAMPYVQFADFRADPQAHPLDTPSGRIEVVSARIAAAGLDGILGHPQWIEPQEWLGRAAPDELHLLTPQPATRLHSQMDHGVVSRRGKIMDREVMRINPADAARRGIGDGSAVRLSSARGSCLAVAQLDDGVMPGAVLLPTGATYDPDPAENDRNSNPNVLVRDVGSSALTQGCAAQSCLVRVSPLLEELPHLTVMSPPEGASSPPRAAKPGSPGS